MRQLQDLQKQNHWGDEILRHLKWVNSEKYYSKRYVKKEADTYPMDKDKSLVKARGRVAGLGEGGQR